MGVIEKAREAHRITMEYREICKAFRDEYESFRSSKELSHLFDEHVDITGRMIEVLF